MVLEASYWKCLEIGYKTEGRGLSCITVVAESMKSQWKENWRLAQMVNFSLVENLTTGFQPSMTTMVSA